MLRSVVARAAGASLLLLVLVTPARAQVGFYTIDSRDPSSIFEIALVPGKWSLAVADGAWNAWSTVYDCDASGSNCRKGWLTGFAWSLDGNQEQWVGYQRFETPELALANAPSPLTLNVLGSSSLQLRIGDQPGSYSDNVGSLTIAVSLAEVLTRRASGPGRYTIDARDPFSIFEVALSPGEWSVAVAGGAWNAWSSVQGCDASGANCQRGWLPAFTWSVGDGPELAHGHQKYATPELALASAPASLSLSVSEATTLRLRVADHPALYLDNQGSLTLAVSQTGTVTPEPVSMLLLGSGLVGVAAARRRRRG